MVSLQEVQRQCMGTNGSLISSREGIIWCHYKENLVNALLKMSGDLLLTFPWQHKLYPLQKKS